MRQQEFLLLLLKNQSQTLNFRRGEGGWNHPKPPYPPKENTSGRWLDKNLVFKHKLKILSLTKLKLILIIRTLKICSYSHSILTIWVFSWFMTRNFSFIGKGGGRGWAKSTRDGSTPPYQLPPPPPWVRPWKDNSIKKKGKPNSKKKNCNYCYRNIEKIKVFVHQYHFRRVYIYFDCKSLGLVIADFWYTPKVD